jgi:Domain of unknown function (DUF5615)
MPLRFLLDENLRLGALSHAIEVHQQSGVYPLDIARVGDAAVVPLGSDDDIVVRWAATEGRILVSQDAKSIERAMVELLNSGVTCPGVILLRKGLTIAQILELLVCVAHFTEPAEWLNSIHWLP